MYKCQHSSCSYGSKRESNAKQHMEKAHGWAYERYRPVNVCSGPCGTTKCEACGQMTSEAEKARMINGDISENARGPPAELPMYRCQKPTCSYTSEDEAQCKQHMERVHGWIHVRHQPLNDLNVPGHSAGDPDPDPVILNHEYELESWFSLWGDTKCSRRHWGQAFRRAYKDTVESRPTETQREKCSTLQPKFEPDVAEMLPHWDPRSTASCSSHTADSIVSLMYEQMEKALEYNVRTQHPDRS